MQDLLTVSIELTAIASLAYFSAMFVLGWSNRCTSPLEQSAPVLTVEEESIVSQLSDIWVASAPVKPAIIADTVVPFIRPQPKQAIASTPDWSALDPFQLRKECQLRSIVWRNLHGRNKHAKKAEMVAALKKWEGVIAS